LDRREIEGENREGETKGKKGIEETAKRVTMMKPRGMRR
jgi:hypothetical protein